MAQTRIALAEEEKRELNRRLGASTVSVRGRQRAQIILLAAEGHTQEAESCGDTCDRELLVSSLCQGTVGRSHGRTWAWPQAFVTRHGDQKKVLETVARPPAYLGAGVAVLWRKRRVFRRLVCNACELQTTSNRTLLAPSSCRTTGLTRKNSGTVLRREITMPGTGAYPTKIAAGHRAYQDHNARLYSPWHFALFATLNYVEGKLITTIAEQHRHQEWLAFLKKIERETPKDLDIL